MKYTHYTLRTAKVSPYGERRPFGAVRGVAPEPLRRRPLTGGVQHAENANLIVGHVIDQDVISVRYQLACSRDAPYPAKARIIGEASGFLGNQLV